MTDLGNAISVLFLVSGAMVMIVLVVMEYAKRLRTHVDSALESMRLELRRELAEQDIARTRMERRIRDVENDLVKLSREQITDYSKIDAAVKSLVATVATLDKDFQARRKQRQQRRGAQSAGAKSVN
ncbi:MAG: hypothetical protein VW338_05585 [Rhodospirillaceae bacterium]